MGLAAAFDDILLDAIFDSTEDREGERHVRAHSEQARPHTSVEAERTGFLHDVTNAIASAFEFMRIFALAQSLDHVNRVVSHHATEASERASQQVLQEYNRNIF